MENKYSVQKQILTTKSYLNTLNDHITHNSDLLNWFTGLCTHLTKSFSVLTEFHKKVEKNAEYKEALLLHLQHILAILALLINIFVRESEVDQTLNELRLFGKKQLAKSLDGISEIISENSFTGVSNSNFIRCMDSALNKLKELDFSKKKDNTLVFNEVKICIEEVLSHAMSIAQVTIADDYKKIRGSSQSILEALNSLSTEINRTNPNLSMLNLFNDSCTNKLCALECKVNSAVLKLSLKVFSEYFLPLEAIHNFCFDKRNRGNQTKLDELVVEFDLHVDRILQIGFFAVSCSSCTSNSVQIRSCMASLEALETELVPGFTSVLLDRNLNNIQLAILLKDHWISQAVVLQKLIYLIIDPHAFCEVIFEESKQLVEEMSENLKVHSTLDTMCFCKFMLQSTVLADFITVIVKEEQETHLDVIKRALSSFKSVLNEVKAAYDILPNDKSSNFRVLKRCKILLSSIKSLWSCFLDENTENRNSSVAEKSQAETYTRVDPKSGTENFLDDTVARGQRILKDRSNLTSIRDTTFKIPQNNLHCRNEHDVQPSSLQQKHLRNKTFIRNAVNELQMTGKQKNFTCKNKV